jgi:predicted Zn-dependent protease
LTAGQLPEKSGAPAASRYLKAIEGLVLGEDPRQGFVEGNVFYHPALRFRFPVPRGFKLINQPRQVVMVENQNRAFLGFAGTAEKSLESAAARFLNQPGLRVIERGPMRSGQFSAFAVVADGRTENGQVVRVMVYFVDYRGSIYQFVGYTTPQAFSVFRGVFLQTMQGFGEIQDPRILNREPVRLTLETAPRRAPFDDLIPKSLPAPFKPDEMAILNQVDLKEVIASGRILKIPSVRR